MSGQAPLTIIDLVARFAEQGESYSAARYKELPLRQEFIDPFFEALGWDVTNRQGYAEAYKEVIHEDALKIEKSVRAPDYCFRIGGTRKFFVETKKPSVNIKDDAASAFQLRRYAWSAKLPLSILTDFAEFAVYDCRVKPDRHDKASTARIMYLTFREYPERWNEIAAIFSRDAILRGSFDRFAASTKGKRGTAGVDDAFLAEIESWRDQLARHIAIRNPHLTQRELNFSVQRTIDRIIFLRICEDRGIEGYGRLFSLTNGANVYQRLFHLFRQADERYNSGLFHFEQENDRHEIPDSLTPSLTIDDKPLKEIIKRLYYPESPYEFSVLPADILGQVYEQFLGKVIRLTAGHRAVVEEKPEVRKAGGVYYTPTYIVDYIVRNTVGRLLEGKTPKEAAKIRVVDPACGSGSFLLGAYQYLLDWHRDWYAADSPEKWAAGRNPAVYQAEEGAWRLTTGERKRILLNSIYGVDIDAQAVEVTKLSLLLKVLEGENSQTLDRQLKFFRERALPDLGSNIKCGNSLIGSDFHSSQAALHSGGVSEEEMLRVNAFDWHREFPQVFQTDQAKGEGRGFDAVIGNPPYVRQEMLGDFKEYFSKTYTVFHGIADLYAYFIERGVSLLRDGGLFSYIVANKWMRANYGEPLRLWLMTQGVEKIIDFGDLPVFRKATTYPCIIRIRKSSSPDEFRAVQMDTLQFGALDTYVAERAFPVAKSSLDTKGWSLVPRAAQALLDKLRNTGVPLGQYVGGKIYYGIKTGLNEAFVIDAATRDALIAKDPKSAELIKPFLLGRDIKRYESSQSGRFLICIPKGWTRAHADKGRGEWAWFRERYPAIAGHLHQFSEKAQARHDKGEFWWELRQCDYYEEFEKPKIIVPAIVQRASYSYDVDWFYSNDKTSIIRTAEMYLLGILNSRLSDYVMHSVASTKQGGYFEYKPMYLQQLPIYRINASDPADKARHDRVVALVGQMLDLHRRLAAVRTEQEQTVIRRQIETTDRQIDHLVYELYGLTEDETKIVEEG